MAEGGYRTCALRPPRLRVVTGAMSSKSDRYLEAYAAPQKLAPLNGRRKLNLRVSGGGDNTVVLAAGLLGLTLDWVRVQPAVARFARVVSFDNAGLGFSDPGRMPRTSSAIVADLRAALRALGILPPYLLVGHSAGGLRMRVFAAQHPEEVTGMVMVDSVSSDWEQRVFGGVCPSLMRERGIFKNMLRLARSGSLNPDAEIFRSRVPFPNPMLPPRLNEAMSAMWQRPSYLRTAISESSHLQAFSPSEALADSPFGALPLAVLTAGQIGPEHVAGGAAQFVEAWIEMHETLFRLSKRAWRRTVDSGHNIPVDAPDAVVEAIRQVANIAQRD